MCLSPDEPAELGLAIEVSAEPPAPVPGEPVELRCRVSDSSWSQWADGVASSGSTLTWSEGGLAEWAEYEGRELIHDSAGGETILRIANFTVGDFGLYRCRCVNDFSYLQYEVCGGTGGLATYCSATTELHLLPLGIYC